jgi:CubicO group peptidase (beta-lactamase class C family)
MKYTFTWIVLLVAQVVLGQGKQVPARADATLGAALTKNMEAEIDAVFEQAYPSHSPGATVLIAKDDHVVYRKAFGMANLELKVPMKPEHVFQLASITKQFTAVAILMLMEQGKLSLQDPLSKYVADFPRGNEITLHHLLNHTSGIKGYNTLPDFGSKVRLDLTPEEMISSFKNLPLEFNPGEKFSYSNSGYFLLGFLIEQISGMPYGDFIQTNIFDRLGMQNSCYANTYRIVPDRASGYQFYEGNYENAEFMSPTIPYAAGSLMSTVDDMFLWNKAMHHNLLISESSKRLAFTDYTLTNGKRNHYGYGWRIDEIEGIPTREHAGGMSGFTTSGIYVPGSNIYLIVLTNLDDGIGAETHNLKAAYTILGKSITAKAAVNASEKELKKWVGAYQFEDVVRFITYDQGVLYSKREGGRPIRLEPLADDEFRFENSFATYRFASKNGKKQVLYANRIHQSIGVETDKKPVEESASILVAPEILSQYVGVYALQPAFQIEVEMQNGRLFATATGQPAVELLAVAAHRFFIKEIDAQIVFDLHADGTVEGLTFSQGGNKMAGKKIK